MTKSNNRLTMAAAALLLAACAGAPVSLGSRVSGSVPSGPARDLTAEACGFQLLLFIPIAINSRMARAYLQIQAQAASDFITDVKVREEWTYGFVGTLYCTSLQAKAISSAR